MSRKVTAIDYLVESIFNESELQDPILKLAIQQAKAMEKQQIQWAYIEGRSLDRFADSEIYYTSTYGS
jgi:hypothetical protein